MPADLLEIRGLSKNFDHFPALQGIDLNCREKDQIILLGSNGAGKTTLLKTIAMLLRPSSGKLLFREKEFSENEAFVRRKTGFIGHSIFLYQDLTVHENLLFFAKLGLVENAKQKTEKILEEFSLSDIRQKIIRSLSKGTQQRVNIARVWLQDPELLLLDEPHSHLDIRASGILNMKLAGHIEKGGAFILATHQSEWIQSLGKRWIILKGGQKVLDQTREETTEDILDTYRKMQGPSS